MIRAQTNLIVGISSISIIAGFFFIAYLPLQLELQKALLRGKPARVGGQNDQK